MNDGRLWFCLVLSTVVVMLGGYFATEHWHNVRFVRRLQGWLWTLLGLILVAIGTLSSTYYWDQITTAGQRRNMVKSITAELQRNDKVLLSVVKPSQSEEEWRQLRIYDRLILGSLEGAISSGLFVDDESLIAQLSETHGVLSAVNTRFSAVESAMFLTTPNNRAVLRQAIEDNNLVPTARRTINSALREFRYGDEVETIRAHE